MTSAGADGALVLRDDDPRADELRESGWTIIAESWGARLEVNESTLERCREAVEAAGDAVQIRELRRADAADLAQLDALTEQDYPYTPATPHRASTAQQIEARLDTGVRAFGAFVDHQLVATTLIAERDDAWDTDFTAVLPEFRRRGIGAAVKAASILACVESGVSAFTTGGAAINAASVAANQTLGYRIVERWFSWMPPSP